MILAQGINGGINGGRPQHWATREPKSCTTDQYVGQPRAQRETPFEQSLPRAGQRTPLPPLPPPNYITPVHSLLCPVGAGDASSTRTTRWSPETAQKPGAGDASSTRTPKWNPETAHKPHPGGINGGRPQHWATREPKSCTADQYVSQPRAQKGGTL